MTDYVPIDCDQHSVLELLAMRRAVVVARYRDERAEPRLARGRVSDVVTRDRAEYLLLESATGTLSLRLDRLLGLQDDAGAEIWCQKVD